MTALGTTSGGWSRRWIVTVAIAVLTATLGALAPASVATADETTTTTTPSLPFPPAPSGFADQMVAAYQATYATVQLMGKASLLTSPADYRQQLNDAGPDGLAGLYVAMQQNPEWTQTAPLMQAIAADMNGKQSATLSSASSGEPVVQLMSAVQPASSASGAVLVDAPVKAFPAKDCADGWSSASIFASQIVIDVFQGAYNVLIFVQALLEGKLIFTLPAKAVIAAVMSGIAGVLVAATIARDVMNYENDSDSCSSDNFEGYVENVDNTTAQTYSLLSSVATSVSQLQSNSQATLTGVKQVQSSLADLEQTFQETLSDDTKVLQQTLGAGAQTLTSNLQTIQSALSQGVASTNQAQGTATQNVSSALDKETATVQASISSTLQQVMHESDVTAQGLTALIVRSNQQVMNTLQANFATTQSEYYADLKRRIERALATGVPQMQFKLPASMGGFLNSTPIGVQQVVNDDLKALQALKVTIQPSTVQAVNAANAAVAAGQWLNAYASFVKAYQAFAAA